jgi:hypothetical protein
MKKGLSLGLSALLMACGVAATNDTAESATQRARPKARPQRPVLDDMRFDQGGMAGCFDPNLSGYARRAAEEIGGVPCETPRRPAPAATSRGASWLVGRWISRGGSCDSDEGIAYSANGTFVTDIQSGRWRLIGDTLSETGLRDEQGDPIRSPRYDISRILSVAANRNSFSVRYPDGQVWHMVRCR